MRLWSVFFKEIKILAKPVSYVSMVSELKEIKNLAKPVTYVSIISELKEIKIFSKASDLGLWSAILKK